MTDDPQGFSVTLGVEEEFFLVHPETLDLLSDPDPEIMASCRRRVGPGQAIAPEFLRAQLETNTRVCRSVAEVRAALRETRRAVVEAADEHGIRVLATSTHPFAAWVAQLPTARERYERFAVTYQETVRRLLTGGMHIHAGFGDADSRIRVMTALRRYLPLFLALSTSSPFSGGHETGFRSYRLNLMGALPRTGVPPRLESLEDYESLIGAYQAMNFVRDGSEIWWDLRPSVRFPTIELRICDLCSRLEEAVSLVALYVTLVRHLLRKDREGRLPPEPPEEILAENRWHAQRYGVFAFLGEPGRNGRVDVADLVQSLVNDLTDDARALGCEQELDATMAIIRGGTSADRQIDCFHLRRLQGASVEEAYRAVTRLMIEETREGL